MKLKSVATAMCAISVMVVGSQTLAATHNKYKCHQNKCAEAAPCPCPVLVLPCPCPKPTMADMILTAMHQGVGRAVPTEDCNKHIAFAGGINTDFHWGNRSMGYEGENNQRISLNDAYLNVFGNVSDCIKAFASLSYSNTSDELNNAISDKVAGTPATPKPGRYSNVYANNTLTLEQAYVTFGNFDCSPFFAEVGKMYTDYGRYMIHPIERTMTQVMTESLHTAAKVGFISKMGFHGSLYTFDNQMRRAGLGHTRSVFGGALGFAMPSEQLGLDAGVGYISNLTGVQDVAHAVGINNGSALSGNGNGTYVHTVAGVALYGDVNTGPFSFGVRYTTALQKFNNLDMSTNYSTTATTGAKPWATDVTAGFGFNCWNKKQNVYLGFQASNNAVNLYLPRTRYVAGYGVNVWSDPSNRMGADLGLELGHDNDYSKALGGSGASSNTVGARVGVKFG